MEHKKIECQSCCGIESCTKYCPIRVGENIVNFVNNLDCVETSIGDIRTDTRGNTNETLIVSGYMLERGSNPIDVITVLSNSGSVLQGKLTDYLGMSPSQILKAYTNYKNLSKVVQTKAVEDLKKFNSNKTIPTPFKPGADIEVIFTGMDNKSRKITTNANLIKWKLDESGVLRGIIIADVGRNEDGTSYAKVKISDYGKTWFLPNIERNLKTSDITREAIKMTDIGLILPVEVSSKDTTIAVDSQHMYTNKNGVDFIIGDWTSSGMEVYPEFSSKLTNDKAFKTMGSYLKFIDKHRRFIIPYGLIAPNCINV